MNGNRFLAHRLRIFTMFLCAFGIVVSIVGLSLGLLEFPVAFVAMGVLISIGMMTYFRHKSMGGY